MRIHYKGKLTKLADGDEKRLAARFARLGTLLDRGSEKEAHVILDRDRRGHRAEITVNHRHHTFAGEAEGTEQLVVLTAALDKLEKQLLKLKTKKTDSKRRSVSGTRAAAPNDGFVDGIASGSAEAPAVRVFRVKQPPRKPITAEEALLLIGKKPYLAFRDASNCLSVIIRRPDGHFDLIES